MANFKYIDEAEAAAKEEAQKAAESKSAMNSSDRTTYWEDLLKDRYEVNKVEEFNSLGKGKRSRKQVLFEKPKLIVFIEIFQCFWYFTWLNTFDCINVIICSYIGPYGVFRLLLVW